MKRFIYFPPQRGGFTGGGYAGGCLATMLPIFIVLSIVVSHSIAATSAKHIPHHVSSGRSDSAYDNYAPHADNIPSVSSSASLSTSSSSSSSASSSSSSIATLYNNFQNQRFAMEPQDQTAVVGARVTLPCRVINKQGVLQWTKDDFGLGTSRDLSGFERYGMIGSDEEGDYSLDIYPVMLDDDARYQCQVSPGPEAQPAIRSTFATLTVLVPPEAPKITQGDIIYTTEDRKVDIECISVGGKPASEITWIDGLGNVITDNIEYTVIPLPDQRRFTAKSVLHLTPKKEHHNTTITCQAQNTADRSYRSAKIRVEVRGLFTYKPTNMYLQGHENIDLFD